MMPGRMTRVPRLVRSSWNLSREPRLASQCDKSGFRDRTRATAKDRGHLRNRIVARLHKSTCPFKDRLEADIVHFLQGFGFDVRSPVTVDSGCSGGIKGSGASVSLECRV